MRIVFVTGGVSSSLGKGLVCASIAAIFARRGLNVGVLKIDPYLNVDAGTMSPYQHGEVFVTEDGAETDLDLGHYERMLPVNVTLSKDATLTAGKVYQTVLNNEREGRYLGKTVQIIPHVTDEIIQTIIKRASNRDVLLIEIGGTVGDIEGLPFLESIRQIQRNKNIKSAIVHLVLVPHLECTDELKTKPAQHSVRELQSAGIHPDILVCRPSSIEGRITETEKIKIAAMCGVDLEAVIVSETVECICSLPSLLHDQGIDRIISESIGIDYIKPCLYDLEVYRNAYFLSLREGQPINLAIVGKYSKLGDSYLSLREAISHAAVNMNKRVSVSYYDPEDQDVFQILQDKASAIDGMIVPGGFGNRGIEGKIQAAKFARLNNVPFLGICLGMQCAVIEFARNVLGMNDANSTEFNEKTTSPVVAAVDGQGRAIPKGGTMRLGGFTCRIVPGTLLSSVHMGISQIVERHRHRYEFNQRYLNHFKNAGMVSGGFSVNYPEHVEAIEITNKPFIAVQYHPEFSSRPLQPHPLFTWLIGSMAKNKKTES